MVLENIPAHLRDLIVTKENYDGPKMLGGTLTPYGLAVQLAPPHVEYDHELIADITLKAHEKTETKAGLHMDLGHGKHKLEVSEALKLIDAALKNEHPTGCTCPGLRFFWNAY